MPNSKLSEYDVLCTIGTGSYGVCKKIQRKADGKIRVWKELDYGSMTDGEKQLLVSEVNLLRELKHENIVRYHDRIIDKESTKIYIIMEYCEGGDLSQLVAKHKKERKFIDETFIWKVLYQISSALKACHNCSKAGNTVLHRDLKPANVFIDGNNDCKLGDFGLARVLHHDTSFAKTFVGTPYYMSPELVNRKSYNDKSDIWSLGCLIYELSSLSPPFLAVNQRLLSLKIQEGHFKPIPSHYSKDLQKIIEKLLTVSEEKRPTIDMILSSQVVRRNFVYLQSKPLDYTSKDYLLSPQVLEKKEQLLKIRESNLNERETLLNAREEELERREKLLIEKEAIFANIRNQPMRHQPTSRHCTFDKENYRQYDIQPKENNFQVLRFLDVNRLDNNKWNIAHGLR